MKTQPLQIALIAGEASGDQLGASLMHALKEQTHATFIGVGGEQMQREGLHSLFAMENLSVMGLIEPLKRLPRLLSLRHQLIRYLIDKKPDVLIGIDAPDFNLSIEYALRKRGVKTVHYVSPSVWAWRHYRIKTIKQSSDLVLTLFPFETDIYQKNAIPVSCVGHPLADHIPLNSNQKDARQLLNLPLDKKIITLLPGSREQELNYLARPFIQTAQWIAQSRPEIRFNAVLPNVAREKQFKSYVNDSRIHVYCGNAITHMQAADALLVTCGTATLEAALVKRPMVVAYKMSKLAFFIAKRLVKVPYLSLPNLLAAKKLVPEYIQQQVVPKVMGKALLSSLENPVPLEFTTIHQQLRCNGARLGAHEIIKLVAGPQC